jgi:F-type H+-transporting ATPase subunit a
MLRSRKFQIGAAIVIAVVVILIILPIPSVTLADISIPAEAVLHVGPITLTNTMLSSWLTMIVLIVAGWLITRNMTEVPGRWQGFLEILTEFFYGLVEGAAEKKWARRFFPIVMTLFLFIIVSNWLGLTPLFASWGPLHHAHEGKTGQSVQWLNESKTVGLWIRNEEAVEGAVAAGEHGTEASTSTEGAHAEAGGHGEGGGSVETGYILAPMFRAATTDLNVTLALAVIAVLLTQYFGVKALGIGYFGKFIALGGVFKAFTKPGLGCGGRIAAFFMGLIDIFIGVVEIISEIGKIVSFSFRLFGNIFAGEVLLAVMAFLVPYLISLPFYGLEIFVGFVQALVFMMLTVAFFVVAQSHHGEEHLEEGLEHA